MDTKRTAEQFEEAINTLYYTTKQFEDATNVIFTQLGSLIASDPNAAHDLNNMHSLTDLVRASISTSQLVVAHDAGGRREWIDKVLAFKKDLDALADNYRQGGNHEEITA